MAALRILHVTPCSGDAWAYGGIARLAATLSRGLARRGHEVTVCTTDVCMESSRLPAGDDPDARRRAWRPRRTRDGVDVHVFPNVSNRLAYRFQLFLPRGFDHFMRRHAGRFDVAHLHACRNLPGVIAARHLTRHRVPYVLAPNGTAALIERRLLAKQWFDFVVGQRVIDRATRVLAVTNVERRQLCGLGVSPTAVSVIPNPVDLDEFAPPIERGRFRNRWGIAPGPVVLFLGKITPRKGLDVLARAVARLRHRDAQLVIAGNEMGGAGPVRALIASLGLADRVRFTGLLQGRERLEALADADVLAYPSQHEIFGLVPLEALLSGTPVIVSDDSGCAEVVQSTGGGQVVPFGDDEALARAVDRVLERPSEWRDQARVAAGGVREAYGEDVVCARIEQMYEGMIA